MPQGKKASLDTRRKVVEAYKAGARAADLAKKYKIGLSSVTRWTVEDRFGIGAHKPKPRVNGTDAREQRRVRALVDHANGKSTFEIAKKHGADEVTVRKWIKQDKARRADDQVEVMADALVEAVSRAIRATIVDGVRALVTAGVQRQVDNILDGIRTRVTAVL